MDLNLCDGVSSVLESSVILGIEYRNFRNITDIRYVAERFDMVHETKAGNDIWFVEKKLQRRIPKTGCNSDWKPKRISDDGLEMTPSINT